MKQRNFKTFSKIDEPKVSNTYYMGYIKATGEYFLSEIKDPIENRKECEEWAELNGGIVVKVVKTTTYYEPIGEGVWNTLEV